MLQTCGRKSSLLRLFLTGYYFFAPSHHTFIAVLVKLVVATMIILPQPEASAFETLKHLCLRQQQSKARVAEQFEGMQNKGFGREQNYVSAFQGPQSVVKVR
jgi:hypothetical protein